MVPNLMIYDAKYSWSCFLSHLECSSFRRQWSLSCMLTICVRYALFHLKAMIELERVIGQVIHGPWQFLGCGLTVNIRFSHQLLVCHWKVQDSLGYDWTMDTQKLQISEKRTNLRSENFKFDFRNQKSVLSQFWSFSLINLSKTSDK